LKRLLIVILVLALAWSGWWVIGSRSAKAAFESWFADRRAEGWQADYADLGVRGFPNRFDTVIDRPALADPATGWSWEAPFVQFLALSYKPTEVIAVFPHEMIVASPVERLEVRSADLKASLALDPAPRLPLDEARIVARDLEVSGAERLAMSSLRLAAERSPGAESRYRYGIHAEEVALPESLVEGFGRTVALPPALEVVELDAHVAWDRPWDMDALEEARPQPQRIDLRVARAAWGPLELAFTGAVDVDAAGVPSGVLTVRAQRWREMLRMAVATGALSDGVAASVERGLALVASLTGNSDNLDVTLDFADGQVRLGPVPLGPAPVLRLR